MIKCFLFNVEQEFSSKMIINFLKNINFEFIDFKLIDEKTGVIYYEELDENNIEYIIQALEMDLNLNIKILVSHKNYPLARKALNYAIKYSKDSYNTLADVISLAFFNGDEIFLADICREFQNIDDTTLKTVSTFIKSGLNVIKASKKLYIHRNTLYYRLNEFIEKTQLDVRDFDNANYFLKAEEVFKYKLGKVHNAF